MYMHVHVYIQIRVCSTHRVYVCNDTPTYTYVVCCVGDFKGKAVHTFVMCAHFIRCCIVDNWSFPIHTSSNRLKWKLLVNIVRVWD